MSTSTVLRGMLSGKPKDKIKEENILQNEKKKVRNVFSYNYNALTWCIFHVNLTIYTVKSENENLESLMI